MYPVNISIPKFLTYLLFLSTILSCSRVDQPTALGEAEYYFDDRLSSVAVDADGTTWLGTNTGDIINYSSNSEQISLGEDRIYKILESSLVDSLYWIGVRNSGLQYWKIAGNNSKKLRTYSISYKGDKYSVYDLVECGNTLYVATSQGLYQTDKAAKVDTLSLCYPEASVLHVKSGFSYVINKLYSYQDSILLAATEDDLLYVNTKNDTFRKLFSGRPFDYVVVRDSLIYALSEGTLYQFNLDGDLIHKVSIENNPKVYYQANGYHFFISTDKLILSTDLERFSTFPLRRKIPLSGRNVITSDSDENFTYLVTDKALWRLSNHMDIFKQNISINLATSNGINNLFLSDKNDLFIQMYGKDEAERIYGFPSTDHLKWMKAIDDDLYYVTVDNKLRKITPSYNEFKNKLFVTPIELYDSQAKITAFDVSTYQGKHVVTLGIQDGMIKIHSDGLIDTIAQFNDKYITSIFTPLNSSDAFYTTLNHGIYYGATDNLPQLFPNTAQKSFINDVILTNGFDKTLIYLTNHHIITAYPADTIDAKGYNGLLYLNDSVFYALPEYGVQKLQLKEGKIVGAGLYYRDIRFDKWASFVYNNRVYLGSNLGVLMLEQDRENSGEWLGFTDPLELNWLYILSVLLFLIALLTLWLYSKNRGDNLSSMKNKISDLKTQLNELIRLMDAINNENSYRAKELLDRVGLIDIKNKNKKGILRNLNILAQELYSLSVTVTLQLPQILEEQFVKIASTRFYDRFKLLSEIEAVRASKNSNDLKKQLIRNAHWLTDISKIETNLLRLKSDLSGCVEIDHLTKGLYSEFVELFAEIKSEPFNRLKDKYDILLEQYSRIHSPEGLLQIEDYIDKKIQEFQSCKSSETFATLMLLKLKALDVSNVEGNVLSVLHLLSKVDLESQCLAAIDKLSCVMDEYMYAREQLKEVNEKLVNRKFDAELDSFIAEQLQDTIEQIEELIEDLYIILAKTNLTLLQDFLKFKNNDGQQAKVLALLIANSKVKRTYIPGMLGIYGNLNPVISRLVSGKIKPNREFLESYNNERDIPSLFVDLMLLLVD